jgi:nitroreductase
LESGKEFALDAIEAIHTRRSIRKFEDKPIPDDLIKEILAAGMTAPSAGNEQPWHFLVITDRGVLDRIPDIHPYAAMTREAQVGILVCGDVSLEKYEGYWVQDCSAAVENMLVAIRALGLGAVWTGVYPTEDRVRNFRELFELPDNIMPFAFIPIGYPAQESRRMNRFREDRVHRNKW